MREGSALERTPSGRGAASSGMGELDPSVCRGKRGDSLSILEGGLLWVRKAAGRMGSLSVQGDAKG